MFKKQSLGLHELKQHKPWFDEECLGFLDQRKWATMQWVQDPSQSNVDNLNNVWVRRGGRIGLGGETGGKETTGET